MSGNKGLTSLDSFDGNLDVLWAVVAMRLRAAAAGSDCSALRGALADAALLSMEDEDKDVAAARARLDELTAAETAAKRGLPAF